MSGGSRHTEAGTAAGLRGDLAKLAKVEAAAGALAGQGNPQAPQGS